MTSGRAPGRAPCHRWSPRRRTAGRAARRPVYGQRRAAALRSGGTGLAHVIAPPAGGDLCCPAAGPRLSRTRPAAVRSGYSPPALQDVTGSRSGRPTRRRVSAALPCLPCTALPRPPNNAAGAPLPGTAGTAEWRGGGTHGARHPAIVALAPQLCGRRPSCSRRPPPPQRALPPPPPPPTEQRKREERDGWRSGRGHSVSAVLLS